MEYNELTKAIATESLSVLEGISKKGIKNSLTFEIKTELLDDYNMIDIRNSKNFSKMFSELKGLNGPVLYIFEILSDFKAEELIEAILNFSNSENSKAIPAIKSKISKSNILYVGKVQNDFWGRLIQHLGYYKPKDTQGLQLFHWAKPLNLEFKITALQFEKEAVHLLPMLEKSFANKLEPILGKHK
jgi:hypothetical protein